MTKAERTRQFIIEKAAPIINRKGMAGTSISDIMDATKLAKGGIYGNFESKEAICAEALQYLLNGISAAIEARLSIKSTYKEKFFELLDYYKGLLGKEGYYGCPMLNFGTEADDTNIVIKQQVSKAITVTENLIYKLIKGGIDAGEFSDTLDASSFAVKAFAMIEGGMWISRVQNNSRQMRLIVDLLKKEIAEYSL